MPIVWHAFKATMRRTFADAIGSTRKANLSRLMKTAQEHYAVETRYSVSPTSDKCLSWRHKAMELDLVLLECTQKKYYIRTSEFLSLGI